MVGCVAPNDPYAVQAWADKMGVDTSKVCTRSPLPPSAWCPRIFPPPLTLLDAGEFWLCWCGDPLLGLERDGCWRSHAQRIIPMTALSMHGYVSSSVILMALVAHR